MLVKCTNCDTSYSVNDEKVRNKKFSFSCPNCATNVIIDNREEKEPTRDPIEGANISEPPLSEEQQQEEPLIEEGIIDNKASTDTTTAIEEPETQELIEGEEELDLSDIESESLVEEGQEEELNLEDMSLDEEVRSEDILSGIDANDSEKAIVSEGNLEESVISNIDNEITDSTEAGTESELELNKMVETTETILIEESDDTSYIRAESQDLPLDNEDDFRPIEVETNDSEFNLEEPIIDVEKVSLHEDGHVEVVMDKIYPHSNELTEKINQVADDVQEEEMKTEDIFSKEDGDVDESITIDLDSLDIQFDDKETNGITELGTSKDGSTSDVQDEDHQISSQEEDLDITIDLDSLDLPLEEVEEVEEVKRGDFIDEEDKITVEDTGTTMEDLIANEEKPLVIESSVEDEIKLKIDEVAPEIDVNGYTGKSEGVLEIKSEGIKSKDNDFDDIDLENIIIDDIDTESESSLKVADELPDVETSRDFVKYKAELDKFEKETSDTVPGGAVIFSIDYSLKYSSLGALARLLILYLIRLLPHLLVILVYLILSVILGLINSIVILFTGESVEDFQEIQENTIRYITSIAACAMDVVEEVPKFAGKKDIDYSLQYSIIYPIKSSRILSILRLSVAGIILITLPHILLLTLLTVGSILVCLVGMISIIVIKRWPNALFTFMVHYFKYLVSVISFLFGVVDRYPSFKFE
ncbi:MAG: DUF4389 domain-containing protein [Spirochaetota bacterium]|nr:DUF4389 domain-containing protein [Spirochaetota bacterium]